MTAPDLFGLVAGALFWTAAIALFVAYLFGNAKARNDASDEDGDFGAVEGGIISHFGSDL